MENYVLREDEVMLFRGNGMLLPNGKSGGALELPDIFLTNINIVLFINKKKRVNTVTEVETYSAADVKFYRDEPQVIRKKTIVEIYLKGCELFIDFVKEKAAKEFTDKALRLLSGNSKFVRGAIKFNKAIDETDAALNIDIRDIAKKTATKVGETIVAVGNLANAKQGTKVASAIAGTFLKKSTEGKTQIEARKEGTLQIEQKEE